MLIKCQSLTLSKAAKISFYKIEQLVGIDTHVTRIMIRNNMTIWMAGKWAIIFSPALWWDCIVNIGVGKKKPCLIFAAHVTAVFSRQTWPPSVPWWTPPHTHTHTPFLERFVIYSTFELRCGWVTVWAKMAPVELDTPPLHSEFQTAQGGWDLLPTPTTGTDKWQGTSLCMCVCENLWWFLSVNSMGHERYRSALLTQAIRVALFKWNE